MRSSWGPAQRGRERHMAARRTAPAALCGPSLAGRAGRSAPAHGVAWSSVHIVRTVQSEANPNVCWTDGLRTVGRSHHPVGGADGAVSHLWTGTQVLRSWRSRSLRAWRACRSDNPFLAGGRESRFRQSRMARVDWGPWVAASCRSLPPQRGHANFENERVPVRTLRARIGTLRSDDGGSGCATRASLS